MKFTRPLSLAATTVGVAASVALAAPALSAQTDRMGRPTLPEPDSAPAQTTPASPRPGNVARIWPDSPVLANALPEGVRAEDLVGRKVLGRELVELGTLDELVVGIESGRVEYGVVSSGGVLGIGETVRLVPALVFAGPIPLNREGNPVVRLTSQQWELAPTFSGDPVSALTSDRLRLEIDGFYRDTLGEDAAPKRDLTEVTPGAGGPPRAKWMTAEGLRGLPVMSGPLEVGEVDSVLVDLNHRGALVRIEPNAGTLATTQPYILLFRDLNLADNRETLETEFTVQDFRHVLPDFTGRTDPAADN